MYSSLQRFLKQTKKVYFYFNTGSNLWAEERSDDSMINRICEETGEILLPEKKHVLNILFKLQEPLEKKKKDMIKMKISN